MDKEFELHEIVNKLEDKADMVRNSMSASLYRSWIDQIISGDAGLNEARQMLKASSLK